MACIAALAGSALAGSALCRRVAAGAAHPNGLVAVSSSRAFDAARAAAGGAFTPELAEGTEAISAERTETGNGTFRRAGVEAAGAAVESAPRRGLAVEADGETVDRLAAARDLVEGAGFPAAVDVVAESDAATEVSPVSASATPVPDA